MAKPARRRTPSPITRRILAVNLLALGFLFAGLLYVDEYRRGLIDAALATLQVQADLFAAALGEGATAPDAPSEEGLIAPVAQQMVRRLVQATHTRARLFSGDGELLADSRLLIGPGGLVQIEELPPPRDEGQPAKTLLAVYDLIAKRLSDRKVLPVYGENPVQKAADYPEALQALSGTDAELVRSVPGGGMILSVAVPVQRYKQVLGALMLTRGSHDIDVAVFQVRLDILKVFAVALAVTVLLSLYLAGTIARPILKLSAAAERVRKDRHRKHTIPDFSDRGDEIGELALALREMTEALWLRMDAIESFAADVSHEIKNPLTSLRSAVETAVRVNDPDKRHKLMTIILEDVQRLDRLISDISDASRLDAELSRAQFAPVDIGLMLGMLVDVTRTAAADRGVRLRLELKGKRALIINGLEGRLVQVFRNLIANAVSFSPPRGTVTLTAGRKNRTIIAEIVDEGPGIPEDNKNEIFLRFYSERPHGEKFGTHSGLGLSISKQIVEAHGGTIFAENRQQSDKGPCGARFVVSLPMR
jgi:two-component system sensor histidine kinase ChvG